MKWAIFEEHSSSCVVYSRFSGTLFPVSIIDGAVGKYQFAMACIRALVKSAYKVITCPISQPKHMLWVLKISV